MNSPSKLSLRYSDSLLLIQFTLRLIFRVSMILHRGLNLTYLRNLLLNQVCCFFIVFFLFKKDGPHLIFFSKGIFNSSLFCLITDHTIYKRINFTQETYAVNKTFQSVGISTIFRIATQCRKIWQKRMYNSFLFYRFSFGWVCITQVLLSWLVHASFKCILCYAIVLWKIYVGSMVWIKEIS